MGAHVIAWDTSKLTCQSDDAAYQRGQNPLAISDVRTPVFVCVPVAGGLRVENGPVVVVSADCIHDPTSYCANKRRVVKRLARAQPGNQRPSKWVGPEHPLQL